MWTLWPCYIGGYCKWDKQEVPECPDIEDHDKEEDKKCLSEADEQEEEEEEDKTVLLVRCAPAAESPLPTIIKEMEEMFLRLGFSQTVAFS